MSAKGLKVKRSTVSKGSGQQLDMIMVLGIVFLVMAVLQVISFTSFKGWFDAAGFSSPAVWAAGVIIAEVLAALGFMKLTLPSAAKTTSRTCAILASGFWFVESIRLVSGEMTGQLTSSGFFGKYLMQSPSWWTILEATILLLWTIHALESTKDN